MKKYLKTALIVALLLISQILMAANTDSNAGSTPDGSLPGEHFDQNAAHKAEFNLQAYKRIKGPNNQDPNYGNNFIDIKVYDQLGLNQGGLGTLEYTQPPEKTAIKATSIDSYMKQFFSKEGLNVATIEIVGQTAYGKLSTATNSVYCQEIKKLKVDIDVEAYAATNVSVDENKNVIISGMSSTPDSKPKLYNSAVQKEIPMIVSIAEVMPITADLGRFDGGTWVCGKNDPANTAVQQFKSPAYNKWIWESKWYGWTHVNEDTGNDVIVDKTINGGHLSLSVGNGTSFYGAFDGSPVNQNSNNHARRRAIPWTASYSINLRSEMTQNDYDLLPSGHYSAVLSIVVKAY